MLDRSAPKPTHSTSPPEPTPGILRIHREQDSAGTVLALEGELDLSSAAELSRQLQEVEETHPGRILIDLSELTFIDSSGLSVVIQATQSALLNGHRLTFRNASAQVHRLLEVTAMLDELTFEP